MRKYKTLAKEFIASDEFNFRQKDAPIVILGIKDFASYLDEQDKGEKECNCPEMCDHLYKCSGSCFDCPRHYERDLERAKKNRLPEPQQSSTLPEEIEGLREAFKEASHNEDEETMRLLQIGNRVNQLIRFLKGRE